MICVSIAETNAIQCKEALKGLDFAEIRIDALDITLDEVKDIFSQPLTLIATFRPDGTVKEAGGPAGNDLRKRFLLAAIDAGARYVDIEAGSPVSYREAIIEKARQKGCRVIVSYHNYDGTPPKEELERVAHRCFSEGADVAKIACMVHSTRDSLRLLGILDNDDLYGRTVVIGMGEKGRITRVAAPFLGSPFTFACLSGKKETAPGQIERVDMEEIVRILKDE